MCMLDVDVNIRHVYGRKRFLTAPGVAGIGTESARACIDNTGDGKEDHPMLHPLPVKPQTSKKSKPSSRY